MHLTPGTRLGPYEIIAPIGAGGMGEVYRAKDARLNRDVAIKVLPEAMATDTNRRERFEREAKAVAALSNSNIINVYDTGVHEGHPFVVMELLDGETLRDRLAGGPLPVRKAVEIAVQIARGLGAAHDKQIVHRDLKPENIFILRDGQVKILDFGLAREMTPNSGATETRAAITDAGMAMGTVGYMAPEQIRAQPVDGRTDLFAFGAVLFEMLSGVRAFQRETAAETMTAILKEDVPDLIGTNVHVPPSLDRIVHHCLEKNPAERFQSARDIAFALDALSGSRGESAAMAAAVTGTNTGRWSALRAFAAVVLIAIAGAAGWYASKRSQAPPEEWETQPIAVDRAAAIQPAWSPDDRTIAYAQEANGYYQIFTRRMGARPEAAVQITRLTQDCLFPVWHPRGDRIYFISNETLWAVGVAGGRPEQLLENVSAADISPDGNTLALSRNSTLQAPELWTSGPEGQAPRRRAEMGSAGQLRFAPNGRRLIYATSNRLFIVPVTDTEAWHASVVAGALLPSEAVNSVSWMPDSRHVVGVLNEGFSQFRLVEIDVDTGEHHSLPGSELLRNAPAVSHDGRRVAYGVFSLNWDVLSIDLATHAVAPLIDGARYDGWPAWAPDNDSVVFSSNRTGDSMLWAQSLRDGSVRPLVTFSDFNSPTRLLAQPSVSPDGRSVVYQRWYGERVQLFASPMGGGAPVELDPASDVRKNAPAWSPDSAWVAFHAGGELRKTRVGGRDASILLRDDLDPTSGAGSMVRWSTTNQILYASKQGLAVTDDAGKATRMLLSPGPLIATWSSNGKLVYAIRESAGRHLELLSIDVASDRVATLADLGPKPVSPEPLGYAATIRGLVASPDGKRLAFGYLQPDAHIWMLKKTSDAKR